MIFDAAALPLPLTLQADLCVVGSGPGGATAAMVAAEAGLRVVVLEAGEFVTPGEMDQREEDMFPRLFWEAGARTTADRAIHVHQGRGVGGSSLHNLNLCKRIPAEILDVWARDRGTDAIDWPALYARVEEMLSVGPVPDEAHNAHNRILARGAQVLGWANGPLAHNRTGCVRSGFCELGCAFDAKNNALKVCIPRAVAAGAEVVTQCQAIQIEHRAGRVVGVEARAVADHRVLGAVRVEAPRVCLSASATGTAALLLRSRVPDPGGEAGARLRLHPAVVVAGEFEEEIRAWEGIPQTWECTEHLQFADEAGPRTWIVPAFAHPVGTATLVPGLGAPHAAVMARYANLAVLTAMVHDRTAGRVEPSGALGLRIRYRPDESDRAEFSRGMVACARLLFAAGARRVLVPAGRAIAIERPGDATTLGDVAAPELSAVHPMGSVPMGADARVAAVGTDGRHHHVAGLWVADGSLFPSSIGVPPQLSIYAMGLRVGEAIVAAGG